MMLRRKSDPTQKLKTVLSCESSLDQGRPVPCRAQIWWIRAVPNISVPCPHDPVPCQIFPCRALMIRAQTYGSLFCGKKGACGSVPTSSGLPEIWVPFLWGKKGACGNVPTSSGIPEIWAPLRFRPKKQGFRTAWLITGQTCP